jgi:hypothetical protein
MVNWRLTPKSRIWWTLCLVFARFYTILISRETFQLYKELITVYNDFDVPIDVALDKTARKSAIQVTKSWFTRSLFSFFTPSHVDFLMFLLGFISSLSNLLVKKEFWNVPYLCTNPRPYFHCFDPFFRMCKYKLVGYFILLIL